MDTYTHYYGSSSSSGTTSTSSTLSGITSTWFKNLRSSSGTVTFTANWTAKTYTVYAYPNGGAYPGTPGDGWSWDLPNKTGAYVQKDVTYDSSYGVMPQTPYRSGYTLVGWFTAESGGTQVTASTKVTTAENHNIYAHWTRDTYQLSVVYGTGIGYIQYTKSSYLDYKTITPGSPVALEVDEEYLFYAIPSTGYKFSSWSGWFSSTTNPKNYTESSTTARTLTASATAITYTVAYNGNGATGGSTASSTHTYGTAKALTANGFTKTGYSFAGWATTASGSVKYADKASATNLASTQGATVTLYAQWSAIFTTSGSTITGLTDSGKLLSSITIPSSIDGTTITKIGDSAFTSCSNLENVTFAGDSAITYVGYGAFSGCSNLKTVILPNSVTTMKSGVFSACTNLAFVYIPVSATDVGGSAFYNSGSVTVYCGAFSTSGWSSGWDDNASVRMYCGVSLTNDSSNPWAMDGESFVSTNHASSSSSTFTLTVSKAYTIRISYKTSSESSYDKLTIKHGSTTVGTYSGTTQTDYTTLSDITLSAGDTITFTYSKDGSIDKGDDCAWFKWEIV